MEESLETTAGMKVTAALQRAQQKFDTIVKDTNNPFFKSKYATLDQVIAATRPHLTAEGLVLVQKNIQDGERYGIRTHLIHLESGEEIVSSLVAKPKEDIIQQVTGILTYARRYEYLTILGLAPEDDDGAVASGTTREQEVRRPQSVPANLTFRSKPITPATTSNTPTAAIAGDLAHSTASAAPATLPKPEIVATPVESTSTPNPDAVPDSREYNDYAISAMAVLEQLQKEGLTGSATVAKNKIKKFLCDFAGRKDIKELTHRDWTAAITFFKERMATPEGVKLAVENVEAANAKGGK